MHAFIRSVMQVLHLAPKRAPFAQVRDHSVAAEPLLEVSFVTEQEALEYAAALANAGYRAVVEQNVYDYSWSVEILPARGAGRD